MAINAPKFLLKEVNDLYAQENWYKLETYLRRICEQINNAGSGAPGARGLTGPAGRNGVDGNLILTGTVPPLDSLGEDNDFYLDTETYFLYGPKDNGLWGEGQPLIPTTLDQNPVIAGETISALRAVYSVGSNTVMLAQVNDLDKTRVYGISTTASPSGGNLNIRTEGVIEDNSLSGFTLNGTISVSYTHLTLPTICSV